MNNENFVFLLLCCIQDYIFTKVYYQYNQNLHKIFFEAIIEFRRIFCKTIFLTLKVFVTFGTKEKQKNIKLKPLKKYNFQS